MKYTIQPLISEYLLLTSKLSYGYWSKLGNLVDESKSANFFNFTDIEINPITKLNILTL